jgi:OOP family OmpA-OmpF porin
MKTTTITLAVVAALALPSQAGADDRMEIGGFGGAHLVSEHLELGTLDEAGQDTPRSSGAFGIRVSYRLASALRLEGELALIPTVMRRERDDITIFAWRAHAIYDLLPAERVNLFALAGVGALTGAPVATEKVKEDTDLAVHIGVGTSIGMGSNWGLRTDVRGVFAPSTESSFATLDGELFVGLYKRFPNHPPPPPTDSDGDGVFDPDDECPEAIEDQDGFEDEDGCPENDNDQDGIDDEHDQCPSDAESMNGIDDTDGCPEPDGDGDGIIGSRDQCPQEAEDKDGFEDEDGCPDPDDATTGADSLPSGPVDPPEP